MKWLALVSLILSFHSLACDGGLAQNRKKMIIPAGSSLANDMTQAEFKTLISDFEKFFGSAIERDTNHELIVIGSWQSNTVNAFAEQERKKYYVTVYGGLARHPAITADGLTATLCHELGHHFGGYPKKSTNKWSSAEGQADYYTSAKCLRRIWEKADNINVVSRLEVPVALKAACAQTYTKAQDQALCQRMAIAGRSVALMIQDLDQDSLTPQFETPEREMARVMNFMHPFSQCRLDTFFQGAICKVPESVEFDNDDETVGSCHARNGDTKGLRPGCWFVSKQ